MRPGMRLAADLAGPQGRQLYPAGTLLDEKTLRVMKIWGVTEAEIEDLEPEEAEAASAQALDPEVLRQAGAELDDIFRFVDLDYPVMRELHRQCVLRRAANLSGERAAAGIEGWCPDLGMQMPKAPPEAHAASADELVRAEVELTSFPDIYFQIIDVINTPGSTASHLAEVVGRDTSVTAKLLRLVNSPLYGMPSRVDSITRAVALLGINELSTLAMGISVISMFEGINSKLISMKSFWQHSFGCGVVAKILAGHKSGMPEERFFVAGILHDIGRLIYCKAEPELALWTLATSRTRPAPLTDIEAEVLGFDHAELAGKLAEQWHFPEQLVDIIAHHHDPLEAEDPRQAAIIHLADLMSVAMQIGCSGECFVPALRKEAWELLDLPASVLSVVIAQAERQVREIFGALLGVGD